jgi:hypothetical protein
LHKQSRRKNLTLVVTNLVCGSLSIDLPFQAGAVIVVVAAAGNFDGATKFPYRE